MYEDGRYDVMQVASGLYPEERAGVNQKDIAVPLLGDMIGDFYPPGFIEIIYNDMLTRTDIKFDTSATEFGRTYDGAVPIRNSSGEGIALLTAGVTLSDIDTTMRRYIIITTACAVVLSALFITFMMLWLRRRVVLPLQKLEKSAGDFMEKSAGQTDPDVIVMENPNIHTGDEIEALADTLVNVSRNTKTYVEDLLASAHKMQDMEQEMTTIKADAVKDALTGVRNKAGYDKVRDRLDWDIVNNIADFGLLMVDLNHLKKVNDTYGHEKGDIYIKKLCKMVCDTFDHSPVFRIGGDEFIVILENNDLKNRDTLISGIKAEMEKLQEDRELAAWERVSAAMGLALYDSSLDDNVESVFKRADKAMYENKKAMKAVRTD